MTVYEIDPTKDERWDDLLHSHAQASIFHTRGWLEALHRTYRYTPIAFTTSPPGSQLTNAIPFCRVPGFLGRQRLVSLPFSDHCVPLVENQEELTCLLRYFRERLECHQCSKVQIRATEAVAADGALGTRQAPLVLHTLDLRTGVDEIFHNFHPSCIRRKIRRAECEGVRCEEGRSEALLGDFYRLLLGTRRTHGLPPQPIQWFRNLIDCLGYSLTIRVAYLKSRAIAAILTLRYKQTMVYKYGCSDRQSNLSGGVQLLLWSAIREASRLGLVEFDMGRTEADNPGLLAFKDRWGAARQPLSYLELPSPQRSPFAGRRAGIRSYLCAHAPDAVLVTTGRLLYRYMG